MLNQAVKDKLAELGCQYQPVAVKYCYARPKGVKHTDRSLSFCQYLKLAQDSGEKFYVQKEDDDCFGKVVLGMTPKDPFAASGQAGKDFGLFRTQAPNARLHNEMPTLVVGSVNYVIFCPASICDFDPDLLILVANTSQADIIMRATSYISGDFWESKTTCAVSCAWTYVYPYLSGKINFCITGMHHGMKRRKIYPEGMHIIAIPYQKLDEFGIALQEMDWQLISFREDEESKTELSRRLDAWQEMQTGFTPKK